MCTPHMSLTESCDWLMDKQRSFVLEFMYERLDVCCHEVCVPYKHPSSCHANTLY